MGEKNSCLDWDSKAVAEKTRLELSRFEQLFEDPVVDVDELRLKPVEGIDDKNICVEVLRVEGESNHPAASDLQGYMEGSFTYFRYNSKLEQWLKDSVSKHGSVRIIMSNHWEQKWFEFKFDNGLMASKAMEECGLIHTAFKELGATVRVTSGMVMKLRKLQSAVHGYQQRTYIPRDRFCEGNNPGSFAAGYTSTPFVWECDGSEVAARYIGGFFGVEQDEQTSALRPVIGWAVAKS